jgi:Mrp family chromosome partitioning ATPase
MTIQEALEKAKQLSRERQLYTGEEVDVTGGDASLPRRRRSDMAQPPIPATVLRKLTPQRLTYDRRLCVANRVMIPEEAHPAAVSAAAAYRIVRARVLQKLRTMHWTSVGVTSPGPGDGKSITAINLAIAMARENNSEVFLLDLDMRSPSLCQTIGVEPREELVRYFTGEAKPDDVFFSVGIEHLTMAGSLASSEQSSELLANGKLEELFGFIRTSAANPLIICDLPPVLSTDDVLVVAPRVDATLVVVAEGRTKRDGLARTLEVLSDFTVAGIVLNRSKEATTDYYGQRSAS